MSVIECKKFLCRHCTLNLLFIIFFLLITFSAVSVIYYYICLLGTLRKPTTYVVETKGCHIPDLDPWDPVILQHLKLPEKPVCKDGMPTLVEAKSKRLYIVQKAMSAYQNDTKDELQCCHRTVWRHPADFSGDEFKKIYSPECIPFNDTIISDDYTMVECTIGGKEVYRDYFAFVHLKPEIEARCEAAAKKHNAPNISVLIMGIDGMSRNHFYRNMPRTLKLLHNMSAIDMAGMNTIGRTRIENLVPLLTGLSYDELKQECWQQKIDEIDLCPWIFKSYEHSGFRMAFGETMVKNSIFIYRRSNFQVGPMDYYLQPALSMEENRWWKEHMEKFCFGTRLESQILIDFIKNFVTSMRSKRFFGFFWDIGLTSHNVSLHSTYDTMYEKFLKKQVQSGLFNRTILVFISNSRFHHGIIQKSYQGYMEQLQPFLYFVFPKWFKQKYVRAMKNMYKNTNRLVTFYDVYDTLQDILHHEFVLSPDIFKHESKKWSKSPRGMSLFLPVFQNRNCSTANITKSLCLCTTHLH